MKKIIFLSLAACILGFPASAAVSDTSFFSECTRAILANQEANAANRANFQQQRLSAQAKHTYVNGNERQDSLRVYYLSTNTGSHFDYNTMEYGYSGVQSSNFTFLPANFSKIGIMYDSVRRYQAFPNGMPLSHTYTGYNTFNSRYNIESMTSNPADVTKNSGRWKFYYDAIGRIIVSETYGRDNNTSLYNLTGSRHTQYNSSGYLVMDTLFDASNNATGYIDYDVDASGNILKITQGYLGNGQSFPTDWMIYTYYPDNKLKTATFYPQGQLLGTEEYRYQAGVGFYVERVYAPLHYVKHLNANSQPDTLYTLDANGTLVDFTAYEYNSYLNPIKVASYEASATAPKEVVNYYYELYENTNVETVAKENSLRLYPNPTRGKVNIESSLSLSYLEFSVFNIAGKVMPYSVESVNTNLMALGTHGLPMGTYFLIVKNKLDNTISKLSFIKN